MKLNIRHFFVIILFLGLFLMTLRPIADPDFWWHLRTGQLIVQTKFIPHTDPFSYTKAGTAWITHEWLSEVLLYGIFLLGNYGLLILVFSFVITGTFILAFLRCRVEDRPYIAGFVVLLGAISTAPTWGVRPQILSLLITSLFLFLLDRYFHRAKLRYLIPLPFITLVWVNLHGGFLLGLLLIGIFIAGGLFELLLTELFKRENKAPSLTLKSMINLCIFLGFCILAALVNPNGIHIIFYPFQTLASPSMQQLIQEWSSPDFHQLMWQPFAWFILALIGLGMIAKKPISPTYIILILIFGYAALRSMRNIPFFILIAIPVMAEQVGSLVRIKPSHYPSSLIFRLASSFLIVCVILIIGLRFMQVTSDQPRTEASTFPKGAVDWLLVAKPAGNIFNTYGWGGYLIWRLYPQYLVFIDGRADVYGDSFIFDYIGTYHAQPGWAEELNEQDIRVVIIERDSPLSIMLGQSPSWKTAYTDNMSEIFTR